MKIQEANRNLPVIPHARKRSGPANSCDLQTAFVKLRLAIFSPLTLVDLSQFISLYLLFPHLCLQGTILRFKKNLSEKRNPPPPLFFHL